MRIGGWIESFVRPAKAPSSTLMVGVCQAIVRGHFHTRRSLVHVVNAHWAFLFIGDVVVVELVEHVCVVGP